MTPLKRGSVTGQALSPIYLHKVDFAYLLVYNQFLTTVSESRLFGSVVRALVSYQGDPGSIASEGTENFPAMLYFVTAIMSSCECWCSVSQPHGAMG